MRNELEAKEVLLEIDDIRLALLSTFSLPIKKDTKKEFLIDQLNSKGINAYDENPFAEDFDTAEKFLLPQKLREEFFRVELDGFELSFTNLQKQKQFRSSVSVFLTLYPKIRVGILLFNLCLKECEVDDVIFLQHTLGDRFKVKVNLPSWCELNINCSMREVIKEFITTILRAFGAEDDDPGFLISKCIEIRSISNLVRKDPQELFENFPLQMYGLLVADEGWRYVPFDTVGTRMLHTWRTRSFLNVVCFGECMILINLEEDKTCISYQASQKQIREKYGYDVEKYFCFSPEIAGLNHGPLLLLENTSLHRFLLNRVSEQVLEKKSQSLKELLREREKLLDYFDDLSHIKITEIGLLGEKIRHSMFIEESTEDAKKMLEELERTLVIKYNQKINLGVIILALISLGIGIIGILLQILT